MHLFKN